MNVPRLATRLVQQFVRRYGHDSHFKGPSMDELPVPKGSWQAQYDANQRRYNAALAFGVLFSIASVTIGAASGHLYGNWAPPKTID